MKIRSKVYELNRKTDQLINLYWQQENEELETKPKKSILEKVEKQIGIREEELAKVTQEYLNLKLPF